MALIKPGHPMIDMAGKSLEVTSPLLGAEAMEWLVGEAHIDLAAAVAAPVRPVDFTCFAV